MTFICPHGPQRIETSVKSKSLVQTHKVEKLQNGIWCLQGECEAKTNENHPIACKSSFSGVIDDCRSVMMVYRQDTGECGQTDGESDRGRTGRGKEEEESKEK